MMPALVQEPPSTAIDIDAAGEFVRALTGSAETPCTWQHFDDLPAPTLATGKRGKKRPGMAGHFSAPLAKAISRLSRLNADRCGVFVTVNETDGLGREASNIVRIRALFIDCDGFTPEHWHLPPSIIVQSRNGPHAYWLVDDCPILVFADAQRRLAAHYGSDGKVCDPSRVMRLPGFLHCKADPNPVTLIKTGGPTYTTAQVLAEIAEMPPAPAREFTQPNFAQSEDARIRRATAWIAKRPGAIDGEGGSAHTFATAAMLVRDFALSESEAWPLLWAWNDTCDGPWTERDLRLKLADAMSKGKHPVGSVPDRQRVAPPRLSLVSEHGKTEPELRERSELPKRVPIDFWIDFPHMRLDKKTLEPTGPDPHFIENTEAFLAAYRATPRYNLMSHVHELEFPDYLVLPECAENANLAHAIERAERHGLKEKQLLCHIQVLAQRHGYHPARDWIWSKPWDGVDRFAALCETIVPAERDNRLASTLLHKWLISCVKAVMPSIPGEKPFAPQGVLTFQGRQGAGKSNWLQSLAPCDKPWIATGRVLDPHDRDSIQQLSRFWITELGEVDATFKRSDAAALKAFITQDVDVYRSAYARREERIPRRTILAATVNRKDFLIDETGNRRWWTIAIECVNWQHGIDMQQLWAQMAAELGAGAAWWLTPDETAELATANTAFEATDPIVEDMWRAWQPAPEQSEGRVTIAAIYQALPNREYKVRTRAESNALANALRRAGVENSTKTDGNHTYNVTRIGLRAPDR